MKKTVLAAAMAFISLNAAAETPKYVFYFIGDGMASSQRQVSEYYLKEKTGNPEAKLVMNDMPIAGITTTHSANSIITDSAASATALASGVKTNSGAIGVDTQGVPVKTLLERAAEKGMKTGVITTTRLTHATPASFVAKNESRNNEADIAVDMANAPVNFYAGGGYSYFIGSGEQGSKRTDDRNLVSELKGKGFTTFIGKDSVNAFNSFQPGGGSKVFASFTASHLPYEIDRQRTMDTPSLSEITYKGIKALSQSDKGFFMMVEGGRIDMASHAQDVTGTVLDTLEFDSAIAKAMDFYKKHPDDTLIVVVGDHETGGLGIGFGKNYFISPEKIPNARMSIEDSLQNVYTGDRKAFYREIAQSFAMGDLTEAERRQIETAMDVADKKNRSDKDVIAVYGGYDPVAVTVAQIQSRRAGVYWTSYAHTANQVPLSAIGKGSEQLAGFKDNVQVAQAIADIMKVNIGS